MTLDEIVRRAPFPLYGMGPDWTGARGVRSAGLVRGEVAHVALSHVAGATELVVHTLFGEQRAPADAPFHAALHLAAGDPPWRPVPLAVDGREQVFWCHQVEERWAAFARVGGVRVVVAAVRWPAAEVRLAVADREGYVTGSGSTTSR